MKIFEKLFNSPSKKLIRGIKENQIEMVKGALAEGATPNRLHKKESLLRLAQETPTIVKLLINSGADVNFGTSSSGYSPLYYATTKKLKDTVNLLVGAGANVNFINKTGQTALTVAASNGDIDIVKILTEAKADVNLGIESALTMFIKAMPTPLLAACKLNHLDIVRILLENGANVDFTCSTGNAFSVATENGYTELLKLIKEFGGKEPSKEAKQEALTEVFGGKDEFAFMLRKSVEKVQKQRNQEIKKKLKNRD